MDTWNRLTAVSGVCGGWTDERRKKLTKDYICINHRHRQHSGAGQTDGDGE